MGLSVGDFVGLLIGLIGLIGLWVGDFVGVPVLLFLIGLFVGENEGSMYGITTGLMVGDDVVVNDCGDSVLISGSIRAKKYTQNIQTPKNLMQFNPI